MGRAHLEGIEDLLKREPFAKSMGPADTIDSTEAQLGIL